MSKLRTFALEELLRRKQISDDELRKKVKSMTDYELSEIILDIDQQTDTEGAEKKND